MEPSLTQIFVNLLNLSPVFGILAIIIVYLYRNFKSKEAEIKTLNEKIENNSKENLKLLYKTLNFFEELQKDNSTNHSEIINEINKLKFDLLNRINNEKK